ncbi:hypothetical protein phiK7A1_117 [Pseudomonas phage phiK7A1]|uniref:Uncharacterized protein n=1 Tax=Pseudomonas phage phiK7A1 TaxID=2759194 RepID=A0A7H0XFW5_9CAUD|nr:hypothetical protein phiK7A1_117 [Pseudomonas phage phiK7A1]
MTEVNRVTLTKQELYDRLVTLFTEQLFKAEDIGQLKKDAKFNKKTNPTGIPAKEVATIAAAAKLDAKNVYEEFAEKNADVIAVFKELSGYDA